jgi:DNA polymerase-4
MSTLTRSATLPYATADAGTLTSTARRLLLDPREVGPIRLLGVGFSGLSDVRQESLFPDLEQWEIHGSESGSVSAATEPATVSAGWRVGDDVSHPHYGHGWVQGAGHGVVSVRFESRSSGPGLMRTFAIDTPDLTAADPLDSLDWPGFSARGSSPAGDDLADG